MDKMESLPSCASVSNIAKAAVKNKKKCSIPGSKPVVKKPKAKDVSTKCVTPKTCVPVKSITNKKSELSKKGGASKKSETPKKCDSSKKSSAAKKSDALIKNDESSKKCDAPKKLRQRGRKVVATPGGSTSLVPTTFSLFRCDVEYRVCGTIVMFKTQHILALTKKALGLNAEVGKSSPVGAILKHLRTASKYELLLQVRLNLIFLYFKIRQKAGSKIIR